MSAHQLTTSLRRSSTHLGMAECKAFPLELPATASLNRPDVTTESSKDKETIVANINGVHNQFGFGSKHYISSCDEGYIKSKFDHFASANRKPLKLTFRFSLLQIEPGS